MKSQWSVYYRGSGRILTKWKKEEKRSYLPDSPWTRLPPNSDKKPPNVKDSYNIFPGRLFLEMPVKSLRSNPQELMWSAVKKWRLDDGAFSLSAKLFPLWNNQKLPPHNFTTSICLQCPQIFICFLPHVNKLHEFVSMRQAKGITFLSIYRLMHIQVCEFKMAIDIGLESKLIIKTAMLFSWEW